MQTIRKPVWILMLITLPQVVMLAVLGKIFSIIKPLFNEGQKLGWKYFCAAIILLIVSSTVYAVLCLIRKKEVVPWFGIIIFSVFIPLLYVAIALRGTLIPASVPGWMMFDLEPLLVLEALIVPAYAYAMLLSVYWLTPKKGDTKMDGNMILAICIPVSWYVLFVVILPWLNGADKILEHATLILFVISSVAFLFSLTRLTYIFLSRKPNFWKKLILPVVLIFPLAGLIINLSTYGPFGNFSHPGFFIAAVLCGVLLLLKEWEKPALRLLVFLGKMLLFPYTLYFFFVFLPYTPLSIVAIVGFGTGFLMLTPTLLFLVHIRSLHIDLTYLREYYNKKKIMASGILMGLILPLTITGFFLMDKVNLKRAMEAVITPSYSDAAPARVNRNGVRRVLSNVDVNTRRDGWILPVFSQQTPLLSAWYRFIVMDNLSLSSEKSELIKRVILGDTIPQESRQTVTSPVTLTDATVESYYDEGEKAWRSWVHLTLKNSNTDMTEYRSAFSIPEGCYIQNYYLYVNQEKKYGLLTDKRAAEWIYRQITTYRQDPGLLRYIGNNQLELRVFPFGNEETRLTGFEIIHKEPGTFSLDGKNITLQGTKLEEPVILADTLYMPEAAKAELQSVTRKNEWFFLVDITDRKNVDSYLERIETFIREMGLDANAVKLWAVNDNIWTVSTQDGIFSVQKGAAYGGGFYVDKAVKTVLYQNYTASSATRPVFVLVTDQMNNAVIQDDFDLWEKALPEGDEIYNLHSSGDLIEFRLKPFENQFGKAVKAIREVTVLAYPTGENPQAYFANDGRAAAIPMVFGKKPALSGAAHTNWEMGIMQQAEYFNTLLHPELKREKQFNLIKSSIASSVMTPLTAYIVLENEAQENMLKEKQKQILAANSDLDLGENLPDQTEMDEPGLFVVVLLFLGWMLIRSKRSERSKKNSTV